MHMYLTMKLSYLIHKGIGNKVSNVALPLTASTIGRIKENFGTPDYFVSYGINCFFPWLHCLHNILI